MIDLLVETDIVKNEKFWLQAEPAFRGDSRGTHVSVCFSGNIARILGIVHACDGILNIAAQTQRLWKEGIDKGRFRLGNQQHIAFIDGLPAVHRRGIEPESFLKRFLSKDLQWYCEVLQGSRKVHEPQVDGSDFMFPAHGQKFTGSHVACLMMSVVTHVAATGGVSGNAEVLLKH